MGLIAIKAAEMALKKRGKNTTISLNIKESKSGHH